MVGGSVFYAAEAQENNVKTAEDAVEHLDKELQQNEQQRLEAERLEQQLSSLVWICTSTQKMSKVTVIDANNPADILEAFNVCQSHLLCIASVPGAKESDYVLGSNDNSFQDNGAGDQNSNSEPVSLELSEARDSGESKVEDKTKKDVDNQNVEERNAPPEDPDKADHDPNSNTEPQSLESIDSETANLGKVQFVKSTPEPSSKNDADSSNTERMSSVQPTMWLGAQNGAVFVHSAVAKWTVCLHSVRLKDAALAIV